MCFALTLCACSSPRHIHQNKPEQVFFLPDLPQPSTPPAIPYPDLDKQTQIDHLGIQLFRLERKIALLEQRLEKNERSGKNPVAPKTKKNTQQYLNDNKLKTHYLSNNKAIPEETDAVTAHENRLYLQAAKYYRQNDFAKTAAILKESDGGNGGESARRNMYLLLQSSQKMNNCESVIEIGRRYVNRFKESTQAPDALYSIGQCQYQLQQKDIARNTWRKLIQSYPGSEAAKRAAIRIKQK